MAHYAHYHSQFLAHRLTLSGLGQEAFARSLSSAKVEMKPHQVDAALFALKSPLSKGAILADEVGLGKTIEAGLVIAQRWAERRRHILLIVPASLRKQWAQELWSKFAIPSAILDAKIVRDQERKNKGTKPFDRTDAVIIVSYEFADKKIDTIGTTPWNLVVMDEAHRLRNVHRKSGAARAKRLKQALGGEKGPFRVLLTATPLQNSLLELYGLVSIVDEHVFGDEDTFKANYVGRAAGSSAPLMLRERLQPVMRRTLRKTVLEAGHIAYTRRNLHLETYEPADQEHKLYLGVSNFLKRPDTILFGDRNNPLVLMGYQKILGSSTYAIAQTLDASISTLKRRHRASLAEVADIETEDERTEDLDTEDDEEVEVDPVKLEAEIAELTALRDLARSIGPNAKGDALASALPRILDGIVAKGGARKAVIFTESVRTEAYLRDLLDARGFRGEIVLLNGSNNDPESRAIYEAWRKRHEGTDHISGSRTADMKAAIVEAFRDHKTILIATESGAEGINLQFCSLVINFDLPWNPQRVEQRIGRCHRFGQKIDVTVVNLLNLKNRAEERIHELLRSKFQLFEGVFGASDQVLGVVGDGIDFEARVLAIVQKARNDEEVKAAFDQLQAELDESIRADMAAARKTAIDHLDTTVVQRLKDRDGEIKGVLDEFERALLTLVRAERPEARFDPDDPRCFELDSRKWTTAWQQTEAGGLAHFRLTDDNLATKLAEGAKSRQLGPAALTFRYDQRSPGGQLADVAQWLGANGWLDVSRVTVPLGEERVERLIVTAITDDGRTLEPDTAARLFFLPAEPSAEAALSPGDDLKAAAERQRAATLAEIERQAGAWFDEKSQQYTRYAADMEKGLDNEIADLEARVKELREQSRGAGLSLEEKLKLQREASKLDRQRDELLANRFARKRKIQEDVDRMLDAVAESLKIDPQIEPVFTLRWELTR
jgi:superfamily II DNA/RNA helicase